ncbi:MAG: hypothetical protein LBS96_05605 [Oscillospiraceae bacterium]|nr:hypothetical protein [Oscillospiraceae bacterium]
MVGYGCQRGGALNLPAGVETPVALTSSSNYTRGTVQLIDGNQRFQVTFAGTYRLTYNVNLTAPAAFRVQFIRNGNTPLHTSASTLHALAQDTNCAADIIYTLSANDTIQLSFLSATDSSVSLVVGCGAAVTIERLA